MSNPPSVLLHLAYEGQETADGIAPKVADAVGSTRIDILDATEALRALGVIGSEASSESSDRWRRRLFGTVIDTPMRVASRTAAVARGMLSVMQPGGSLVMRSRTGGSLVRISRTGTGWTASMALGEDRLYGIVAEISGSDAPDIRCSATDDCARTVIGWDGATLIVRDAEIAGISARGDAERPLSPRM